MTNVKQIRDEIKDKAANAIAGQQEAIVSKCLNKALGREVKVEDVVDRVTVKLDKVGSGATATYRLDDEFLVQIILIPGTDMQGGKLDMELQWHSPHFPETQH